MVTDSQNVAITRFGIGSFMVLKPRDYDAQSMVDRTGQGWNPSKMEDMMIHS
jgi:hypothetical protein